MKVFSLYVISDLNLQFTEKTPIFDESIPDVDLVVINGNIGPGKRSMLYTETLCHKYPTTQFVYNLGFTEKYLNILPKMSDEGDFYLNNRRDFNESFPKNLHYNNGVGTIINLRNGFCVDILSTFGYPHIHTFYGDWKETYWYKNVISEVVDIDNIKFKKIEGTSNVRHGHSFVWADPTWINQKHEEENNRARIWENTVTCFKIYVTHISPLFDERMQETKYSSTQIHLKNGLWITANAKLNDGYFAGARLVSNPGRSLIPREKYYNFKKEDFAL